MNDSGQLVQQSRKESPAMLVVTGRNERAPSRWLAFASGVKFDTVVKRIESCVEIEQNPLLINCHRSSDSCEILWASLKDSGYRVVITSCRERLATLAADRSLHTVVFDEI